MLILVIFFIILGVLLFTILPVSVDLVKPKRHFVVDAIICINIIVFLRSYTYGSYADVEELFLAMLVPGSDTGVVYFLNTWGLVPNDFSVSRLVTHMFVHAGALHIFMNMFLLYIFGIHVEKRLGAFPFLLLYMLGGFAAAFLDTYVATMASSSLPRVGASGAVFAVLGAFLVIHPRAKVRVFYSILFFVRGVGSVRAVVVLTIAFLIEVFYALAALSRNTGVAHSAHVGGFFFGLAATYIYTNHVGAREEVTGLASLIGNNPILTETHRSLDEQQTIGLMKENIIQSVSDPNFPPAVKEQGLNVYQCLVQKYPEQVLDSSSQLQVGRELEESRRFVAALDAYRRLLAAYPDHPAIEEVLFRMGCIHLDNLSNPKTGREILEYLVERSPSSHWAQFAGGRLR